MAELLVTAVCEVVLQLTAWSVADGDGLPVHPVLVALLHLALGAFLGWVSVVLLPTALMPEAWRTLNLVGAPLATGLGFASLGWARPRFRFLCGVLLAVGVLVIRHATLG